MNLPARRTRCVGVLLLALGIGQAPAQSVTDGEGPALRIADIFPDKARYAPGDRVRVQVDLENRSNADAEVPVTFRLLHLGLEVLSESRTVAVGQGGRVSEIFGFDAPEPDFRGYLAIANLGEGEGEGASTGVDISSSSLRFPRYGYVSDFTLDAQDGTALGIAELAQKFHINMFQFYDWFWRHEKLVRRDSAEVADAWADIFGRINVWPVIRDLIETARTHNSLALAYVMSYAAREGYEELWPISPAWGLFDSPDVDDQLDVSFMLPFGLEPSIFLFNPGHPGWTDWVIGEYKEAINLAGFDGLHIDQLGPRYDIYGGDGQPIDLPNAFVAFLDAVKQGLLDNDPARAVCTFNLVDGTVEGWAVPQVATADNCDFLFSELWFETETYDELLAYIEYLRTLGGGRAVVLAGYSNYGQDLGPTREAEGAGLLEGVSMAANQPGFTGSGFVDGFDAVGDSMTWFVEGPVEAGNVTFAFRFANATGRGATRNLYMDDRFIGRVRFGARDQWSTWGTDAWLQAAVEPGPHAIRLAYDEENVGVVNIDHLRLGELDEDSVRLENAVMFASGATHIQLGDDIQALGHEYYPNREKSLTESLREALRRYYDFVTAYENLLLDPDLMLLGQADGPLQVTTGQPLRPAPEGRLFTVRRSKPDYEILHLINLMGIDNERWRDSAPIPVFQEDIGLRYYVADPETIGAVWTATPDFGAAIPVPLAFTTGQDERGGYVELTVPRLEYWGMIVMSRS